MLPELQSRFLRIETLREELTAKVAALKEEDQRKSPAPGEWSPLEVMAHFIRVENLILDQVEALRVAGKKPIKPFSKMLIAIICSTMRAGIRVPVPEGMEPPAEFGTLGELAAQWSATRLAFQQRLAEVKPDSLTQPVSLHPIAGPLTPLQVVEMAESHMIYHLKRFPRVRGVRSPREV